MTFDGKLKDLFAYFEKNGVRVSGSVFEGLRALQERRRLDEVERRRQHQPLAAKDADGDTFHYFIIPPPAGYLVMVRGDFLYRCCDPACDPHGILLDQMDGCVLPEGPETPDYRREKALYGLGWRWVQGWYCPRHREGS